MIRHYLTNIDENMLLDLYINQKMSMRQIAKYFNCTHNLISKKLKMMNIELRSGYDKEYYKNRKCYERPSFIDGSGYVVSKTKRQHRVIMEKHLGRKLTKEEHVHHIDFDKTNNDIANLFLFKTNSLHHLYHGYIKHNNYISPQDFVEYYNKYLINTFNNYNWLLEQYINQNKSCNQISKELKISRQSIVNQLKKLNIYYLRHPTINQFDSKCS